MPGRAIRHLDARPLTDAVGVEIRGVDVASDPDEATINAIRATSARHGVLLFRNQSLDAPGLAAFSRRFGCLAHSGNQRYSAPDAADVMLVGNLVVDGGWKSMFTNGREDWHVDQIYTQTPTPDCPVETLHFDGAHLSPPQEAPSAGGGAPSLKRCEARRGHFSGYRIAVILHGHSPADHLPPPRTTCRPSFAGVRWARRFETGLPCRARCAQVSAQNADTAADASGSALGATACGSILRMTNLSMLDGPVHVRLCRCFARFLASPKDGSTHWRI